MSFFCKPLFDLMIFQEAYLSATASCLRRPVAIHGHLSSCMFVCSERARPVGHHISITWKAVQLVFLSMQVIDNDYFLTSCKEEFVENARMFIFETYCRIHNCIELKTLAAKLGMEEQSAEKWIVNLIRNARLNAKIDSQAGTVVMNMSFPTPTEQITEKAKDLSMRTFMLANAVVGAPRA